MTGLMKPMSRWASRNRSLAITGLIGCEIANAVCGLLLGSNGLADLSGMELVALGGVVLIGTGVLHQRTRTFGALPYTVQRYRLMGVFGRNVVLFALLGGYWTHTAQTPSADWVARGSRRIVRRSDTLINPADSRPKPVVVRDADGYIISRSPQDISQSEPEKNKRFGYVMLFLLSIFLTYVSTVFACTIACSGYGALAALTFMLGLGFLAGGVYFLGRTSERPIVPLREQPLKLRRRTVRRFWLSWLILIGVFGISLLTCSR